MVCSTGGRSGGSFSCRGRPRWRRPTKRSPSGRPTAARPSAERSRPGRAPVAGEAAGVGGEQDDVGGDGGRVQVLLVLDRVVATSAQETTISVGARSSLAAPSGPATSLSRSSARGPTTRKRQGAVRWWFGAQRASSSSSLDLLARERLRPEGLVGAASANRGLDVHAENIAAPGRRSALPAEATAEEEDAAEGESRRWRGRCRSGSRARGRDCRSLRRPGRPIARPGPVRLRRPRATAAGGTAGIAPAPAPGGFGRRVPCRRCRRAAAGAALVRAFRAVPGSSPWRRAATGAAPEPLEVSSARAPRSWRAGPAAPGRTHRRPRPEPGR